MTKSPIGIDERFPLEYKEDYKILFIIQRNEANMNLLKKLQSTD